MLPASLVAMYWKLRIGTQNVFLKTNSHFTHCFKILHHCSSNGIRDCLPFLQKCIKNT